MESISNQNTNPIGLKDGTVELRPYAPEWKRLFELEKDILNEKIGKYVLDIQHVGSTAILGMLAKPVIDIGIAVLDFEKSSICIHPIEELGYVYRGEFGIPRRHYFVKGRPRTYQIHMNEINSEQWRNLLIFRDYLLQHKNTAEQYAQIKIKLAQKYPIDREKYQEGKSPFIRKVLDLAIKDEQFD